MTPEFGPMASRHSWALFHELGQPKCRWRQPESGPESGVIRRAAAAFGISMQKAVGPKSGATSLGRHCPKGPAVVGPGASTLWSKSLGPDLAPESGVIHFSEKTMPSPPRVLAVRGNCPNLLYHFLVLQHWCVKFSTNFRKI